MASIALAMKSVIGSSSLSKQDQNDILNNLASIPVVLQEGRGESQRQVGIELQKDAAGEDLR
jgi:hypothetical protein